MLTLVVDPATGALALLTQHGAALFHSSVDDYGIQYQPLRGFVVSARDQGEERRPPFAKLVALNDGLLVLESSSVIAAIGWRYLRIHVATQSRRAPAEGPRECSMAAYDSSAESWSYECGRGGVVRTHEPRSLIYFDQTTLLITDRSTYFTPREPLPNGRVRCINESPTETATCAMAYSRGIVVVQRFRAQWGIVLFDTAVNLVQATNAQTLPYNTTRSPPPRPAATPLTGAGGTAGGAPGPVGTGTGSAANIGPGVPRIGTGTVNNPRGALSFTDRETKNVQNAFTAAYTAFYQYSLVRLAINTRTTQLFLVVPPLTSITMQFWLNSELVKYRWRMGLLARGGFVASVFGRPVGSRHDLGDLSDGNDLTFVIFGELEQPVQAEVGMSVLEDVEVSYLGLRLQVPPSENEGQVSQDFLVGSGGGEPTKLWGWKAEEG
jgi:hypothetical protein